MKKMFTITGFDTLYNDLINKTQINHLIKNREAMYRHSNIREEIQSKIKVCLKIIVFVMYSLVLGKGLKKKYIISQCSIFFDLSRQQLSSQNGSNPEFEAFLSKDFFTRVNAPKDKVIIISSKYSKYFLNIEFIRSYKNFLISNSQYKNIFQIIFYFPIIFFNIFFQKEFYKTILDLLEIHILDSSLCNESAFIITNSSLEHMPSIFYIRKNYRGFRTLVVLYSENHFVVSKGNIQHDKFLVPCLFVDEVYVWTTEYRDYLNLYSLGAEIYAIGSIMFQLKSPEHTSMQTKIITVFDIIPDLISEGTAHGLEQGLHFLNEIEKFKKLLLDNNMDFRIILKHARRIITSHREEYLSQIEFLKSTDVLEEALWSDNIYSLVKNSQLVITALGTSPALIAREFSVPVVYLCPENEAKHRLFVDYKISIVKNAQQLFDVLKKC